ncbi:glycosyltransferase [Nocardioides sp. KR10-350]|uniref:glycosyltransferase n=1 Tax=Nocardioides cheoyonin TaxID=3156615 RepID=UPI0032B5D7F4
MAELLFVTWDGGGNVAPALAVARELQARGHRVRFLGHAVQSEELAAAGTEVVPAPHARPFTRASEPSAAGMLAAFADRGLARDLTAELARRPADLVVVDALMFSALDAVRRAGVAYVVLEHFLDSYYEEGCLGSPLAMLLRFRGLAPRTAVRGARARIVTALPELDTRHGARGLTHVGPVVGPVVDPVVGGARRDGYGPAVLVSLSTFGYRGMAEVLQRIVDGTAGLGVRVVVTTGPLLDPARITAYDGVEVHRHVPHTELMPEMSLVVGHGGHGTTMQALAHDLPVLLLPLYARSDQPWVARAVERAGAGRSLPRDSPPAAIAAAAAALLEEGAHRAAAARLGAAIRGMPGAAGGADAVELALS